VPSIFRCAIVRETSISDANKLTSQPGPDDEKQDQIVKGIIALILATLFFAVQDAITKHLTSTIPVAQLIAIRFFFFALFALIYASRKVPLRRAFHSR
jgi:hypothetical protein